MTVVLRQARRSEAAALAVLADMAGHGMPSWFWAQGRSKDGFYSVVEVGRDRILSKDHTLYYEKMTVADEAGEIAGMLLDYPIDEPMDEKDISKLDVVVQPLLRLEARAPGSWYINMIAVFREFRGRGVGLALMEESIRRAQTAGKTEISLIVEDDNPAVRFYRKIGFELRAEQPFETFPGALKKDGNLHLMVRAV